MNRHFSNAAMLVLTPVQAFFESDFDNDGLSDLAEWHYGSDPKVADTDGGGVPDGWEVLHGFDPTNSSDDKDVPEDLDIDNDGVLNKWEGAEVDDWDSDGDGFSDANEIGLVDANNDGVLDDLTDTNSNGVPDIAESIGKHGYRDFDGDGVPDFLDADADNDGVHDKLEYGFASIPEELRVNPFDYDNDGFVNGNDYDMDGDFYGDHYEQALGALSSTIEGQNYTIDIVYKGGIKLLSDDDCDGIPYIADVDRTRHENQDFSDKDRDGIADRADIDHAERFGPPYVVWDEELQMDVEIRDSLPTFDDDNDGIENDYDLDSNNDGALDLTEDDLFVDRDGDGVPNLFDRDHQNAYVPGVGVVVEDPVPLEPFPERVCETNFAGMETPPIPGIALLLLKSGAGSLGFWMLLGLFSAVACRRLGHHL